MQCDQVIDIILSIGRVLVLILGMFSGIITIYLGWKLYKDAVISRTSGEVNYKSMKIVLTSGGPGVFLAIFGAYVLITVLGQRLELGDSELKSNQFVPTSSTISQIKESGLWLTSGQAQVNADKVCLTENIPAERCAIKKTTIKRLFTGGTQISPSDIRTAIDLAVQDLDRREMEDSEKRFAYRKALATLSELRRNIVE